MKAITLLAMTAVLVAIFLCGCGETINGLTKDAKRIGHGVKTIFVRGE